MTTRYIFSNDCQKADQARINIIAEIAHTDNGDMPALHRLVKRWYAPNDPRVTLAERKTYITQLTNTEQYVVNSNHYDH